MHINATGLPNLINSMGINAIYLQCNKIINAMKVTIIKNGSTRLILIPEDDFDKAVIKEMDGCVCVPIKENLKIFDQSVSEGLVLDTKHKISNPKTIEKPNP